MSSKYAAVVVGLFSAVKTAGAVFVMPEFPVKRSTLDILGDMRANSTDLQERANAFEADLANIEGAVSDNADAIVSLEDGSVADNAAAIIDLVDGTVADNTAAIVALEDGAVADNAAAIAALEDGSVADNAAAIAALEDGAVADNTAAIAALEDGTVADNTAAIAALEDGAVADNAADIISLTAAMESGVGEGALGTETNPSKSCRYILQMGGAVHNGHYWIDHDGAETAYKAYCDMGRGGLELVAKIQHGISGNAVSIWESGGTNDDVDAHNNLFASGDHFVSAKLESFWDDAGGNLHSITAGAFTGNRRNNHFTFTAAGTDYESWFSSDYLVDSSYSDLLTETINFFSIAGDTNYGRSWFVNSNYGGCSVDAGWLVLDSQESDPCAWEKAHASIDVLYNPYQTKTEADNYLAADAFVVAIDYDVTYSSCVDALLQSDFRARDGQYWVDHAGTTDPQIVYCDMEHGGYELVYKVVHGGRVSPRWDADSSSSQNPDANALWEDSTYDFPTVVARNVDVHDETNAYGRGEHYASPFRHSAFDDDSISIDNIEVRVVTAEETVKFLQFTGFDQSDSTSWFGKGNLGTTSWSDLTPDSTFNYFSIAGHDSVSRNWFVNSNYGGCSVDSGWLCVVGRVDGCDWEERQYGTPDVMYACSANEYDVCSLSVDGGSDCATMTTSDTYCFADLLAVFYRWTEA